MKNNIYLCALGIGSVDETKTAVTATALDSQLNYQNDTEKCQGTYSNPSGNILVRFQLEDWQAGESWVGLTADIKSSSEAILAKCSFNQNSENSAAPYTRSSQCAVCLPDNAEYSASVVTSNAAAQGSQLIRVASSQCDNVFLSFLQQSASFSLSNGICNQCPSGYSKFRAYMTANVTDDDYVDYTWYGDANWTMYSKDVLVHSGTLTISDAEADRYCVPNGEYSVLLDDSVLYENTGLHAQVTFSSKIDSSDAVSVTLSGMEGVYIGLLTLGEAQTWYENDKFTAPINGEGLTPSGFGSAVTILGGIAAVGTPNCDISVSGCTSGGSVDIYEITSNILQRQIVSPDPSSSQSFGCAVSIGAHLLAVGASGDSSISENNGMVYIFEFATGYLTATVYPETMPTNALFGSSVAIFDGTAEINIPEAPLEEFLIIGAPGRNTTGMVSIYYLSTNANASWIVLADLSPPAISNGVNYGQSVSWHTTYGAASGTNSETNAGFVVTLFYDGTTVDVMALLIAAGASSGDMMGFSVSLFQGGYLVNFGVALAAGAPGVDKTYLFTLNPTNNVWTQNSFLSAPETYPPTALGILQFGYSVAVYEGFYLFKFVLS